MGLGPSIKATHKLLILYLDIIYDKVYNIKTKFVKKTLKSVKKHLRVKTWGRRTNEKIACIYVGNGNAAVPAAERGVCGKQ